MHPKNKRSLVTIRQMAWIEFQTSIINADGSVAKVNPFKRNLILDSGLDLIASNAWTAAFAYCAVGTSTTPTSRDSGSITFTRAGNVVTASASFFVGAGDVGMLLKFDTGEEMYVTNFNSVTSANVSVSGTLGAAEGTLYAVNQTGLFAEVNRTNAYQTNTGDNGTSYSAGTYTHKRTFLFSAAGSPVVLREIGWSPSGGAGPNLLGRAIIPGGGDSLLTGQQYLVVVRLNLTITPDAALATAATDVGNNGYDTSGTYGFSHILGGFSSVGTNGGVASPGSFEPSQGSGAVGGAVMAPWSLDAMANDAGNVATLGIGCSIASYVTSSFVRDLVFAYTVGQAVGTHYGFVWGVGLSFNNAVSNVFGHLFNTPQTKDSLHTLTVTLRFSWGRILTN